MIVEGAWRTGEPGVFFIDRANEHNPVPRLGSYEATNPCGEQPLLAYDVCNLGSINVGAFARERAASSAPRTASTGTSSAASVHLSTHFLDNVIDANRYPLGEIDDLARADPPRGPRHHGLGRPAGAPGRALRLGRGRGARPHRHGLHRGGDEGRVGEAGRVARRLPRVGGVDLGPRRHCARDASGNRIRDHRRLRNCNLTTVAPTGTISIIAGCSGGIEPLFAVAFMRNQAGVMMPDVNEDFVARAKAEGWHSDDLMKRIAEEGHIHFDEVPREVQDTFRTAHDITPEWHVRMQGAFQDHVDSAISKTTNFAHEATREDVRKIYEMAFELGCKGVTVYRDGSRPMQVLSTGKTGQEEEGGVGEELEEVKAQLADARAEKHELEGVLDEVRLQLKEHDREAAAARHKRRRPSMLKGRTVKVECPLGDLYVTINEDDKGKPFEVFCTVGKAGGAAMADSEAIGRLISLSLRSGIPITAVRDQLRGISCDRAVGVGPQKVLSAPDAIAQAIERYLAEKEGVQEELPMEVPVTVRGGAGVGGGGGGGGA